MDLVLTFCIEKVEKTWQKSDYLFISASNNRDCFVRQFGALGRDAVLFRDIVYIISAFSVLKVPKPNTGVHMHLALYKVRIYILSTILRC